MLRLEIDEGRPGEGRPRNVTAGDLHILAPGADVPRCRHCGHIIWSRDSIAVGVGRDCRRLLARAAREVAA